MRTTKRPASRRDLVVVGLASLAAVVALFYAGSTVAKRRDAGPQSAKTPGVSHVHGLGVNPADGALVIATHFGSFRLRPESTRAQRIGTTFQDTMGFTVVGADHYLGSGHPDIEGFRNGSPAQLGLIESIDAGKTWRALSLGGRADFHGLAVVGETVFAWDAGSGRFMVSTNKRDWEERSNVALTGFAVNPRDTNHVIATTGSATIESIDGGRSWKPADAPQLAVVSWSESGLWGAESGGAVWQLGKAGWVRVGDLRGEPQAMVTAGDTLFAAAWNENETTVILRSTNAGRTWKLRYTDGAR